VVPCRQLHTNLNLKAARRAYVERFCDGRLDGRAQAQEGPAEELFARGRHLHEVTHLSKYAHQDVVRQDMKAGPLVGDIVAATRWKSQMRRQDWRSVVVIGQSQIDDVDGPHVAILAVSPSWPPGHQE